ncbi:MAG: hypothetical protein Q8S55_16800 [Methylococcaceae bacterium]|nr:hypothetical protein [Methylococcaceae bacterium]
MSQPPVGANSFARAKPFRIMRINPHLQYLRRSRQSLIEATKCHSPCRCEFIRTGQAIFHHADTLWGTSKSAPTVSTSIMPVIDRDNKMPQPPVGANSFARNTIFHHADTLWGTSKSAPTVSTSIMPVISCGNHMSQAHM